MCIRISIPTHPRLRYYTAEKVNELEIYFQKTFSLSVFSPLFSKPIFNQIFLSHKHSPLDLFHYNNPFTLKELHFSINKSKGIHHQVQMIFTTILLLQYRPICLSSTISKTMQRMVIERLSYIIKERYLSNNQYGFHKQRSTNDCILILENTILETFSILKKSLFEHGGMES